MTSNRSTLGVADVSRRLAYHDDSLPFALLWSEKAGCTSLLKWFAHHIGRLDEAQAHSEWIHHWEHDVLKAEPAYAERLVERLRGGLPVFKLVRDPFARAVSSYLMLLSEPEGSDHFSMAMRAGIRRSVYGTDDVPYTFGFVDFLRWLEVQQLTQVDEHLAPQWTPLEDALGDVQLLRIERFEADLGDLEQRFDLPAADYAGVTDSAHHTSRTRVEGLNPDAVARLQVPVMVGRDFPVPPSSDFMSGEAIELIGRIYRADIERYGYATPSPAPTGTVRGDRSADETPGQRLRGRLAEAARRRR